jgi:hypothetical protein
MWEYVSTIAVIFLSFIMNGWMIFAIILRKYLHVAEITEESKIEIVREHVKDNCAMSYNGKPSGVFISRKPFAFGCISSNIETGGNITEKAWIISSHDNYKILTHEPSNGSDTCENVTVVNLYERHGNFAWFYYSKRSLRACKFTERESQRSVLDSIVEKFQERKQRQCPYLSTFIWGAPGTGKSSLGLLLAARLKGSLVYSFNPSDPGDSISKLYKKVKPQEDAPLIIVLDEIDIMLSKTVHISGRLHKKVPIQIRNKTTWCQFFDMFDLGLYENTIILMTSNTSLEDINLLDPSYLREGRTHLRVGL